MIHKKGRKMLSIEPLLPHQDFFLEIYGLMEMDEIDDFGLPHLL